MFACAKRCCPLGAADPPRSKADRWKGTPDSYTTMRGTAASLPFAATLAHVRSTTAHTTRGQITAALTAPRASLCRPELDFVYFLQNPTKPLVWRAARTFPSTQTGAVARITLTQPRFATRSAMKSIAEITAAFVDVGAADVRAVVLAAEGPHPVLAPA